jgi:hypothetical protein
MRQKRRAARSTQPPTGGMGQWKARVRPKQPLNQNHLRREGATGCCRTGVGSAGGGLGRASAELTWPAVAPKRGWVRR